MRLPLALLLLALSLSGCAKHLAQLGALFNCVVTKPDQVDPFFDGLKTKLASEGFTPDIPATGFVASAGLQPGASDRVYWFKGSYRGSPPFYLKLVRDGPHLEAFHIFYYWEISSYVSPEKEMNDTMKSLHATLFQWAKDGKLAFLPPGS